METGEEKTIIFGLTGTGYFDMVAYEKFHDGQMSDYIPTDADLQKGFDGIPRQRALSRYYNYYIIKEKRAPDPGNTLLLFCAPSSANRKPPAYLYAGGLFMGAGGLRKPRI